MTTSEKRFMPRSTETVAFGRRIRSLRQAREVTARWVAKEAGITSPTMTFLEAGRSVPSAETLASLADVFGVTMDELWRGAERVAKSEGGGA